MEYSCMLILMYVSFICLVPVSNHITRKLCQMALAHLLVVIAVIPSISFAKQLDQHLWNLLKTKNTIPCMSTQESHCVQ